MTEQRPQPSMETLLERCEAYKGQVEAGAARIRELESRPSPSLEAMREALELCRPEIERQVWKCRSDATATPLEAILDKIDLALNPTGGK